MIVDGAFSAEERQVILGWVRARPEVTRISRFEGQVIVRFGDGCRSVVVRCTNITAALERAAELHRTGSAKLSPRSHCHLFTSPPR